MKVAKLFAIVVVFASILSVFGFVSNQEDQQIDAARLKEMIVNLGYTVSDLNSEVGKEKYEFKLTESDLDIPVSAEISPSKNYVWLTVFLGAPPAVDSPKNAELLKQNFSIQPCQFYVTSKGNLMMAIAIDNRSVSPAVMSRNIKKLVGDVGKTKDLWLASQ